MTQFYSSEWCDSMCGYFDGYFTLKIKCDACGKIIYEKEASYNGQEHQETFSL